MNNSYITIIKEKRTVLSRKRVPLNQNECTADFRIGVPFEQNLHEKVKEKVFAKIECVQNKQKYKINIVKNNIFTKLDKGYIMYIQT